MLALKRILIAVGLVLGVFLVPETALVQATAPKFKEENRAPSETKPNDNDGIVYTNADLTVKVAVGTVFSIRLPSNPSTGYQWRLTDLADNAPVSLREHRFDPPSGRRVGAGGHENWIFNAVRPGAMELGLTYLRPWEPDQPHTQCVFKVEIQPAAQ